MAKKKKKVIARFPTWESDTSSSQPVADESTVVSCWGDPNYTWRTKSPEPSFEWEQIEAILPTRTESQPLPSLSTTRWVPCLPCLTILVEWTPDVDKPGHCMDGNGEVLLFILSTWEWSGIVLILAWCSV